MMESLRNIFNLSQKLYKHNSALKQLIVLQNSLKTKHYKEFYKELKRNIKFTLDCDYRSPYTQNSIVFIVKYLLTFNTSEEHKLFIDEILKETIIPRLKSPKVETRINSCHLIRKLMDELDDINEDLYKKIKNQLVERCADKISAVRVSAIQALHRFQDVTDVNDLAIEAIHFHLKCDPDYEVRHNSLKSMAASKNSLNHFIYATNDIKDVIRKTAYIQIVEKLQIKCFTIEQRLTILKNGLKDRSPAVRKVVETLLITSWVKSCDNDLIQLLVALDIQTDIELIEKMLDIYFKRLNGENVSNETEKTKFQQLVDEFRDKYLTKNHLLKSIDDLTVENVFLWRFLCEFCKSNQIECKTIETIDQNIKEEAQSQETQRIETEEETVEIIDDENQELNEEISPKSVDLFDLLVPDVPYFCEYLEAYISNVINRELIVGEVMDFEFIYNQLLRISLLFEIGDDAQRSILVNTLRSILINTQISDRFHNYINPIMKCLAKNGFPKDKSSYLNFTVDIISEIFHLIPCSDENDSNSDEMRELENKNDILIEYKNELNELESEGKDIEAEEMKKKINDLQLEIDGIRNKESNNSQFSQSSQRSLPSLSDHPKHLLICLHIFSGCLEFGEFTEVNSFIQTHIERVCLPGFLSEDINLRIIATRCLGLVCLITPQYFKRYFHFLIEVFLKDLESIKLVALKSIFDSLCEHGLNIFGDKNDNKVDKNDEKDKEESVQPMAFDDNEEDFISSLKDFFDTQLNSELNEIKYVSAQGVAKLLIHRRMYSPELLSKLIIIWFNPKENQILVQFIGDFLKFYSFAESEGVIVGQSALEEAFIITLETLFEKNLKYINLENLVKFFIKLIADESHTKLVTQLVDKIVNCDSTKAKLAEDYYLLALSHMSLLEMESKDLDLLKDNMTKIVDKFADSKSKNTIKRVHLILDKIESRKEQLTADQAFAKDFESVDENSNNSELNQDSDDSTKLDPIEGNVNIDCLSPLSKRKKLFSMSSVNDWNENESQMDNTSIQEVNQIQTTSCDQQTEETSNEEINKMQTSSDEPIEEITNEELNQIQTSSCDQPIEETSNEELNQIQTTSCDQPIEETSNEELNQIQTTSCDQQTEETSNEEINKMQTSSDEPIEEITNEELNQIQTSSCDQPIEETSNEELNQIQTPSCGQQTEEINKMQISSEEPIEDRTNEELNQIETTSCGEQIEDIFMELD